MATTPVGAPLGTAPVTLTGSRDRIDRALESFLAGVRSEIAGEDPSATMLLVEIDRLVRAGGKRLRPTFCYWGHRASGGVEGEPIVRASASLELLHTMALIHDDLMDGSDERRGVPSSALHLAGEARRLRLDVDPEAFGRSVAILAGDLAAVLADRMLLEAGFPTERLAAALGPYHRMRTQMAVGQFLDVAGLARDAATARRSARLKGGAYTVEGPLAVGAALAGAGSEAAAALAAFGAPLGEAFQLRDDLVDGDGADGVTPDEVNALVAEAREALARPGAGPGAGLEPAAVAALDALAAALAMP